jgi:hypothetical protein
MSFLTGTSSELLYSSIATGTQLNTFTTEDNLQKTLPYGHHPGRLLLQPGATGKSSGQGVRPARHDRRPDVHLDRPPADVSTTWSAAGVAWSTAALTAGTGRRSPRGTSTSTSSCGRWAPATGQHARDHGRGAQPARLASPFAGSIPGNNTAFTVTTFDNSVTQYLPVGRVRHVERGEPHPARNAEGCTGKTDRRSAASVT